MQIKNLILIGSSHIAKQSLEDVRKAVETHKPKIICVELDKQRYIGLKNKQKSSYSPLLIFKIGLMGYIFALIGHFVEHKLGKYVGISPGSEMLYATELAQKTGANIGLIDRNIDITLKRFSKKITFKEKWTFVKDIFRSIFFKKKVIEEYGINPQIDLTKVPDKEFIAKAIKSVKTKFPNVYQVIIHERNVYMANKLRMLMEKFPDETILAVVGAGHVEGIDDILKKNK